MAVICVLELTLNPAADWPPNCTDVTFAKLVPLMTTAYPPAVAPAEFPSEVTVGVAR